VKHFKKTHLTEKHKLTDSITNSMKTLLEGEVKFIENHNNWSIEILVKWNKKRITVTIKSQKSDLKSDFVSCSLTDANFLSFLTRTDAFNFSGEKSEFSELIMESVATKHLMDCKNASLKLDGKNLIFNGGIRKNDESSLSNIFILNEMLMEEIDKLNEKTFHNTMYN